MNGKELLALKDKEYEPQLYKKGDIVITPAGRLMVDRVCAHGLINDKWVPQYKCCKITKDGTPSKIGLYTDKNKFHQHDLKLAV